MAAQKRPDKPADLRQSAHPDCTDKDGIESKERGAQHIVSPPAHSPLLYCQEDLVENIEGDQEQANSSQRNQMLFYRMAAGMEQESSRSPGTNMPVRVLRWEQ